MSSDAVAVKNGGSAALVEWNETQMDILREQLCPGASDGELALLREVSMRHGLDPFTRQIYGIMRRTKDGDKWVEKLTIQVGIDGLRVQAQRSGNYAGQTPPQWTDGEDCPKCDGLCSIERAGGDTILCPTCDGTGVRWRGVWVKKENPAAARVGVYVKSHDKPVWGVASFARYAQKTGQGKLNSMWNNMGPEMVAKCAEAQALRKACPNDCSGLYTPEEMNEHEQLPAADSAGPPTGRTSMAAPQPVEQIDPPAEQEEPESAPEPDIDALQDEILMLARTEATGPLSGKRIADWHATMASFGKHGGLADLDADELEKLRDHLSEVRGDDRQRRIANRPCGPCDLVERIHALLDGDDEGAAEYVESLLVSGTVADIKAGIDQYAGEAAE